MNIQKMFLTPNKYSRPQIRLNKVTKIAVHYVGNAGSTALATRNYFNNLGKTHSTYASSHYVVGLKGEIIQCIPEEEMSYCTNQANSYSISIENCHPDSTGKFNEYTYNSLKELCGDLCKRYGLDPVKDIIRHYDVTKKCCPRWWAPNGPNKNADKDFKMFKADVKKYMEGEEEMTETINIKVNGKDIKADAIVKEGQTFLKLRSLENAGFKVDYDPNTKTRVLRNEVKEQGVVINDVKNYVESVNIDGFNYCKVRDIAGLLGKMTEYDGENVIIR